MKKEKKAKEATEAKEQKEISQGTVIANNNFVAVQYDATAVEAIHTIAAGLMENAKALGALARVLSASNVHLECFVKVGETKTSTALNSNMARGKAEHGTWFADLQKGD